MLHFSAQNSSAHFQTSRFLSNLILFSILSPSFLSCRATWPGRRSTSGGTWTPPTTGAVTRTTSGRSRAWSSASSACPISLLPPPLPLSLMLLMALILLILLPVEALQRGRNPPRPPPLPVLLATVIAAATAAVSVPMPVGMSVVIHNISSTIVVRSSPEHRSWSRCAPRLPSWRVALTPWSRWLACAPPRDFNADSCFVQ